MGNEEILLEMIKLIRSEIRGLQDRIFNLASTFIVSSFAISAFVIQEIESSNSKLFLVVTSDIGLVLAVFILYKKIHCDLSYSRCTLEVYEDNLVAVIDGTAVSGKMTVKPEVHPSAYPRLPLTGEVKVFYYTSILIVLKMVIVAAYIVFVLGALTGACTF